MSQIDQHPITDKLWEKAAKLKVPLTGAFELLPLCNYSCRMCYVRKSRKEVEAAGGLIPTRKWLEWAEAAGKAGMLFPLLTGGEPFLRPDFFEIMAKMLEMGMQVSINSNGSLIDEKKANWLGKHRPIRLNITLYGSGAASYEELCGNGEAFEKVREGVRYLKKYDVPVKFNASITPENVNDMPELIEYAHSVNSPIQIATYMFPPLRRSEDMVGKNHRLSPEEAGRAKVEEMWLQGDKKFFAGMAEMYSHFIPMTKELLSKLPEAHTIPMVCRAGASSFWIDWQGNISNCGMYPSVKFPMKEMPFEEAWKNVVDQTLKIRYASVCTGCPNFHICHSCIAMVYNECGDTGGRPEYLCRYNQSASYWYQKYCKDYLGIDFSNRELSPLSSAMKIPCDVDRDMPV